jgi:hypothetical protein
MKDLHKTNNSDNTKQAKEGRRKFLKQAGKVALYAPPAVLVLSKTSFAGSTGAKCSWTGDQQNTGPVREILGSILHHR